MIFPNAFFFFDLVSFIRWFFLKNFTSLILRKVKLSFLLSDLTKMRDFFYRLHTHLAIFQSLLLLECWFFLQLFFIAIFSFFFNLWRILSHFIFAFRKMNRVDSTCNWSHAKITNFLFSISASI